jgi:acetoacetyl-CoA synthetase
MKQAIWSPSVERIARANMTAFIQQVARFDPKVRDYPTLYQFSVDNIPAFWSALWNYFEIAGHKGDEIVSGSSILDSRWFPEARLNFAQNHLRRRDDAVAIIAYAEGGGRRVMSFREVYDEVSRLRAALAAQGVGPSDRVAACLPNCPEAVIALLAATSLGAIWSACSPDYGIEALIDRFGQIQPKVLFVADGYRYAGKTFELHAKNAGLASALSTQVTVLVPYLSAKLEPFSGDGVTDWASFVEPHAAEPISFDRFPFEHPLYILYSSGTTGKPKAIVHGAGATLLQSMKELALHCDLGPGEPTFFQTNIGWVVWNIMVAGLALGSPIVLYDGSPSYPKADSLFDILGAERVAVARIVPPMIESYIKSGVRPVQTHDLSSLKCILSGSAPLLPHHYEFVYTHIKKDLHLMSPAGGTDLLGSLVSGNPIGPVYAGEIQARSLGMMVEVFDESARSVVGTPGELVCTRPFPSVPLWFWGDENRDRVREQYFSVYPGVWRHGDWAEITPEGGAIIYGRSDSTLNVNGVRIGTAEIYRGLEKILEIREAVAVAQRTRGSEHIVLFVVMNEGHALDAEVITRIKHDIRERATARHVPEQVIAVPDLLRTHNGKPSEVAIRDVINGRQIKNTLGLSNPETIRVFEKFAECQASASNLSI